MRDLLPCFRASTHQKRSPYNRDEFDAMSDYGDYDDDYDFDFWDGDYAYIEESYHAAVSST